MVHLSRISEGCAGLSDCEELVWGIIITHLPHPNERKHFYYGLQHKIVAKLYQSTLKEGNNSRLLFLTHQFELLFRVKR